MLFLMKRWPSKNSNLLPLAVSEYLILPQSSKVRAFRKTGLRLDKPVFMVLVDPVVIPILFRFMQVLFRKDSFLPVTSSLILATLYWKVRTVSVMVKQIKQRENRLIELGQTIGLLRANRLRIALTFVTTVFFFVYQNDIIKRITIIFHFLNN